MDKEYKIISERLKFREIAEDDFDSIYNILKDKEIMYAWGHGFSKKETKKFIGLMGPLIEDINGEKHIGVAYILDKRYWGLGYATEGVSACIKYAFDILKANKVIAEIRPENIKSRKVAERIGMKIEGEFIKFYNGENMLHLIYSISKEDREK